MSDEEGRRRARNLLSNELFNEAFDVLRKDLMAAGNPAVRQSWKPENQSGLR